MFAEGPEYMSNVMNVTIQLFHIHHLLVIHDCSGYMATYII